MFNYYLWIYWNPQIDNSKFKKVIRKWKLLIKLWEQNKCDFLLVLKKRKKFEEKFILYPELFESFEEKKRNDSVQKDSIDMTFIHNFNLMFQFFLYTIIIVNPQIKDNYSSELYSSIWHINRPHGHLIMTKFKNDQNRSKFHWILIFFFQSYPGFIPF